MKASSLKNQNIGVGICTAIVLSLCSSASAQTTCFGIPDNDPDVCSGHGTCIASDTCSCDAGYTGDQCQFVVCFSIPANDPTVCSGHGACIGPDTCSCDAGYTGDECGFPVCFGVAGSAPAVCSGNGTCTAPDTCSCDAGYTGDECQFAVCFGVPGSDPACARDMEPVSLRIPAVVMQATRATSASLWWLPP